MSFFTDAERVFIRRFVRAFFPLSVNKSYEDDLNAFENQFIANLFITESDTGFSTAVYVQYIINTVITIVIETGFAPRATRDLTEADRMCIRRELLSRVNQTVQNRISDNLEELRRAVTTVRRIRMFYQQLRDNLTDPSTRVLNECARFFVNLRCAGCRQEIGDTCRATCLTVLRACFSPYYSQLTGQLNVLWSVSSQSISAANRLTMALRRDPTRLLTFDARNPLELASVVSTKRCI